MLRVYDGIFGKTLEIDRDNSIILASLFRKNNPKEYNDNNSDKWKYIIDFIENYGMKTHFKVNLLVPKTYLEILNNLAEN